jgi:tetratricopeptide (TPR) repeat protein
MEAAAGPLVLARHELSRGRPDRALAALDKVGGAELDSHEFWPVRASSLLRLHRWDDAVVAARAGLEREPDNVELLDVVALAYSELRNKAQALEAIESAISLYPDAAVLHAHKALILVRNAPNAIGFASYRRARAAAEEALRLDPNSVAAIQARAQVALVSGERRAHKFGARLLSLDPEREDAHLILGSALTNRGRVTEGHDHYFEAARLDPENPEAARLAYGSRSLRHPAAFVLRLLWRAGPLPVLATILVIVVTLVVLVVVFGVKEAQAPLAIIGLLFLVFFYYLIFSAAVLHGNGQRRSR